MVLEVGLTMCDIEVYKGKQWREPELILKKLTGTDCFLKLGSMKMEWLVIADKKAAVNLTRTMYTPPVAPREFIGLKVGKGRILPLSVRRAVGDYFSRKGGVLIDKSVFYH